MTDLEKQREERRKLMAQAFDKKKAATNIPITQPPEMSEADLKAIQKAQDELDNPDHARDE